MGTRYLSLLLVLGGCGPIGKSIAPPPGAATAGPSVDDALVRTQVLTGWAKQAAGQSAAARQAFTEAVRLDPASVDARLARARFLAPVDPDAAKVDLQAAAAADSRRGDVWWELGALGDTEAVQRARDLGTPEAWAHAWNGTPAYADEWGKIPLVTPTQHMARARARAQVGDHEGAVQDALAAVRTETDAAAIVLAGSAVEARRVGPALDALLDETPQSELARLSLVTLARAADDPVRTLQALPYFPVSDNGDDPRLLLEVDALRRIGRYDAAVKRADAVLDARKGWAEMLRRKAHAQLDAGKPRAAAETLAEPIIGAWTPMHTLMRARALAKAGRGDEALRIVEADQWRDAESVQMAYALVVAGAAAKEAPTAGLDAMNRGAARLTPALRADAYAEARLVDKAVQCLSTDDPVQVEHAGKLLLDAGRIEEGVALLDAGTLRWPERVRLWTLLGRARGRDMEFEVARGLDPSNEDALLWFAKKGDLSTQTDLSRALEGDPGNPRLLQAQGALWMAQGMPMRAVVSYEEALARAPDDKALRETLAEVYTSLGDPFAAERSNPKVEVEEDDAPRVRKHARVHSKKSGKRSRSRSRRSSRKRGKSRNR